ncbi:MAG: hypothetical protein WAS75_08855, partial [Candidatus Microthrix subdominans]
QVVAARGADKRDDKAGAGRAVGPHPGGPAGLERDEAVDRRIRLPRRGGSERRVDAAQRCGSPGQLAEQSKVSCKRRSGPR